MKVEHTLNIRGIIIQRNTNDETTYKELTNTFKGIQRNMSNCTPGIKHNPHCGIQALFSSDDG